MERGKTKGGRPKTKGESPKTERLRIKMFSAAGLWIFNAPELKDFFATVEMTHQQFVFLTGVQRNEEILETSDKNGEYRLAYCLIFKEIKKL
ncbi:hypothetical protein DHW03_05930 [Pedobacter yonginense]|uniref:Uncharacterized protein n=1 Tax=Pedobacter yonginense TaxID=651869 RepID=A0A317ETY0_9SPHI|nr:hypothetical protein [Pedobacter yonginense]PWS29353.1 hypothetical protein DHW03_05930 [Pedobacter yonginense]